MSDDEFASKFMDAIFSPSEQGIPTNEENKRKAREYLSSLRTLAAQAKANEADAERWRKVKEGCDYELSANHTGNDLQYFVGKRTLNVYYAAIKDSSHA